ncbi:MAG TPA: DUF1854 domain-containing protein [Planctomycetota bacterium]|nr:DUF1854 domain-containing protein [Planctomycetota bacterium]
MPHHFHDHGGGAKPADTGPSLPMPDETSSELRFLDPASAQFRQQGARLQFREKDAEDWRDVTLVRLFPLTESERWVSLVEMNGKEVGILKDATRLAHDALLLVRDELRRRYLVPRITRILACRPRADLVEWTVETDRGQQKFLTRDLREQIKEHLPTRLSIVDVEGNRYDIPALDALDPESRRRLDAQL